MSEDICDKLVRFNEHKQCISTDLEVEAAAEITRLRNDLRNAIFSERDYVKEIERQDVLLREENARLREALEPIVKIKAFTCIYEWTPVEALRDDEEVRVKLTGAQIKKMREAAIREGGNE